MPKYLLTNEAITTYLWKMLETNPAYSEDLTTKAKPGKGAVGTDWLFIPGVLNTTEGWWDPIENPKRGWRTENPLTGTFAAGDWYTRFRLENDTKYTFSVRVQTRFTKSPNPDGSYATLVASVVSPAEYALPAAAGGSVSGAYLVYVDEKVFSNEYLFAEFCIVITVAGTSVSCQCSFAVDEDPAVADESITTTTFTPPAIVETIVAKDFPMLYLAEPLKAKELSSRVSGATITTVAKDFPEKLLKTVKAKELRSRWT